MGWYPHIQPLLVFTSHSATSRQAFVCCRLHRLTVSLCVGLATRSPDGIKAQCRGLQRELEWRNQATEQERWKKPRKGIRRIRNKHTESKHSHNEKAGAIRLRRSLFCSICDVTYVVHYLHSYLTSKWRAGTQNLMKTMNSVRAVISAEVNGQAAETWPGPGWARNQLR